MSNFYRGDPDEEIFAMCHRNHADRAGLHDQISEAVDAEYEPVQEETREPVIRIFDRKMQVKTEEVGTEGMRFFRRIRRILGAAARWGAGALFLCGVADGLIDTTYGLMLTIICIGWGLLHLLQGVAHG